VALEEVRLMAFGSTDPDPRPPGDEATKYFRET
jgi:hypothetical protein